MAESAAESGKISYRCGACGLAYAARELAGKYEAWCTEHKSCNLEIVKNALPESGEAPGTAA